LTLYHAAPPGSRPSPRLAIRLATVAGVPVEVLLGGKVVVAPIVIGVAARGRASDRLTRLAVSSVGA
jgi:hypothetical protein